MAPPAKSTKGAKARAKQIYRSLDAATAADVAQQKAAKSKQETVKRKHLPGAAGKEVPLEQLSRKELQAKALECGLAANAKSADIIKALKSMKAAAMAGAAIGSEMLSNPMATVAPKLTGEAAELADLDFLGIKGRTPNGTKWRSRVHHNYNLRSTAPITEGIGRGIDVD